MLTEDKADTVPSVAKTLAEAIMTHFFDGECDRCRHCRAPVHYKHIRDAAHNDGCVVLLAKEVLGLRIT